MDMAQLTISEEWIRKKLNITHDNLEDIKSLSLAGTYQEKICFLGKALQKFTRLKELDLSRNSLISLEGLENCKQLEKLNLYYNNISSLKELERLRFNSVLSELDLRLNPITKEENDYRLYLIHILPSLRMFDDRSIRDSERQMALTYFDQKNNLISSSVSSTLSSVSMTSTPSSASTDSKPPPPSASTNNNPIMPRVKSVNNIVKRSAGICEDDKNKNTNCYPNILNLRMHDDYYSNPSNTNSSSNFESNSYQLMSNQQDATYFNKSKSCSMQNLRASENQHQHHQNHHYYQQQQQQQSNNNKSKSVHFNEVASYHDLNSYRSSSDNNLNAYDESDTFNNFKSRGSFTLNPSFYNELNGESHQQQQKSKNVSRDPIDSDGSINSNDYKSNQLFLLLDLVDRYWNGSKSLHQNQKFLSAALQLVSNEDVISSDLLASLQSQLRHFQDENKRLQQYQQQNQLNQKISNSSNGIESLNDLQHKNLLAELDIMKKKLIQSQEENKRLQKELNEKTDKLQIDTFESQNGTMKREIEIMRIKLKQYEQLQQLTGMLQESHKSLVTTNEHLLQEISNHKRQQLRLNTQTNNSYSSSSNNNSNNDINLYSPSQQQQLNTNGNGVPKSNGSNKSQNARFSYSVK